MSITMYKLSRPHRDDDYIAAKDGRIVVHSSLCKKIWEDPDAFGDFEQYQSTDWVSYYGAELDPESQLKVLWTKE